MKDVRGEGGLSDPGRLPAPPGRRGEMRVMRPLSIKLRRQNDRSYTIVERRGPRVLDRDEGRASGHQTKRARVPRSYTSRWLSIDLGLGDNLEEGEHYLEGILDENERLFYSPLGNEERRINPRDLQHPLRTTAFENIQ